MKHINGYYVDDHNNKWSDKLETEESAVIKSKTMIKPCEQELKEKLELQELLEKLLE